MSPSPICQKKKTPEPGPNVHNVSGPDGLAGLYFLGIYNMSVQYQLSYIRLFVFFFFFK